MRLVLRLPRGRSTLSVFVAGSIAAHVILTLAVILVPLGRRHAAAASDSMVVELAGPMPGPAAGGSAAPPAPKPEPPAPPAPKPEPQGPTVVEPPKEKKDKKKDETKERKPPAAEPQVTKPAPPSPPSSGRPGPPGAPGGGVVGGSGGGAGGSGSSELGWYWASVTAAIRSHWVRPVLEGGSGVLTVTITFEVRRDGTVANVAVETGSGVPSLDRSALRAVADAAPLPPIPTSSGEASLPARYQFELTPGEGG